jgi:hypothetical protein
MEEFHPYRIISDYSLPTFDGMQAFSLSLEHATGPFLFIHPPLWGRGMSFPFLAGGETKRKEGIPSLGGFEKFPCLSSRIREHIFWSLIYNLTGRFVLCQSLIIYSYSPVITKGK